MNNKVLKYLNPLLLIAFLSTVIAMVMYKLPGALNGSELAGEIHETSGTVFIVIAILHVFFNWGW
ncbi:MAG: hypothetical protein CVU48_05675, partial [Candidatus Cloacimonetes bacterium HGW-Cloacimonetes-1]